MLRLNLAKAGKDLTWRNYDNRNLECITRSEWSVCVLQCEWQWDVLYHVLADVSNVHRGRATSYSLYCDSHKKEKQTNFISFSHMGQYKDQLYSVQGYLDSHNEGIICVSLITAHWHLPLLTPTPCPTPAPWPGHGRYSLPLLVTLISYSSQR